MSVIDNLSDTNDKLSKPKLNLEMTFLAIPIIVVLLGFIYIAIKDINKKKIAMESINVKLVGNVTEKKVKTNEDDLIYSRGIADNSLQFRHVVESFTFFRSYLINDKIAVFDGVARLENGKNFYIHSVWSTRPLYSQSYNSSDRTLINPKMDVLTFLKDVPYYIDYNYGPKGVWFIKEKEDLDERMWMDVSNFDINKMIVVGTDYTQ